MNKLGLIVEGEGEVASAPILIRRFLEKRGHYFEIRRPFRVPRGKLVKPDEISRAVEAVARQTGEGAPILVLLDADDDCIAERSQSMTTAAKAARSDRQISIVLANREFESWFLAAIDSLRGKGGVRVDAECSGNPEAIRDAKGALRQLMATSRYSPTVDQAALASLVDLDLVRSRSQSFDKPCRELEQLVAEETDQNPSGPPALT